MGYKQTLERLLSRQDLSDIESAEFLDSAIDSDWSDVQVAAILTAWQAKGATGMELASLVRCLMNRACIVDVDDSNLVDLCGTGGGPTTFNISTAAAFVVAAAGAKVAKHGNRAVTSSCGSADVLNALGIKMFDEPALIADQIMNSDISFLLAPNHHPSLKALGPVRKELEVRTVLNQVGPLANPARVKRQLIGVYRDELLRPMADALVELGCVKGLVVYGIDGLDEVSPCAVTKALLVESGGVRVMELDPAELGMELLDFDSIRTGSSAAENAEYVREALTNPGSPYSRALIPSSAAALWVSGVASSFTEGGEMAIEAIQSGRALDKLNSLVNVRRSQ